MKEELKIKDVMIGDWVDVRNDADPNTPHLERITPSHFFRDEHWYGVELVSEILEKNGFENIGDDIYQLEEKPCWFWVDFFKHTYGCEYDTSTYEYEDDEHRLKLYGIPSVHELQHALSLCGIEKEIEL
jgi:hypothetical protein